MHLYRDYDFSGSDDDFRVFCDEYIILLLLILVCKILFASNKLLKLKYIHHYFPFF
jgi:hypothetical protein